ncbi:hypothetical protein ACLKA7_017351 [Drosophila subpalustris]
MRHTFSSVQFRAATSTPSYPHQQPPHWHHHHHHHHHQDAFPLQHCHALFPPTTRQRLEFKTFETNWRRFQAACDKMQCKQTKEFPTNAPSPSLFICAATGQCNECTQSALL